MKMFVLRWFRFQGFASEVLLRICGTVCSIKSLPVRILDLWKVQSFDWVEGLSKQGVLRGPNKFGGSFEDDAGSAFRKLLRNHGCFWSCGPALHNPNQLNRASVLAAKR